MDRICYTLALVDDTFDTGRIDLHVIQFLYDAAVEISLGETTGSKRFDAKAQSSLSTYGYFIWAREHHQHTLL